MFAISEVCKMKKLYYLYNTSNKDLVNLRIKRAFMIMLAAFVLIMLFDAISAFGGEIDNKEAYSEIRIEIKSGDTLWDISKEYGDANQDIRTNIAEIMSINQLDDANIKVGQILIIRDYSGGNSKI